MREVTKQRLIRNLRGNTIEQVYRRASMPCFACRPATG